MVKNTATGKDSMAKKQGDAYILKRLRHLEKENAELKALHQAIWVSEEQHRAAIENTHDITEHKIAVRRVEHLNRVLRSIRDVNQLIVRERDPDTLIKECCRLLVDNRGYALALIVLTDENNRPVSWAASGIAASGETLHAMREHFELPPCCDLSRAAESAKFLDIRPGVCGRCPIGDQCAGTPSLCVRLIHEDTVLGYLVAALDHELGVDDEEQELLAEMAQDLAFTLNFLQMEKAHELSERKRESLEVQLVQAQKMESLGRLAGGVAHDFNNMLTIIIGYADLALDKVDPVDPLHADLGEILAAATRSADITRQLLAFSRQQIIAPEILDLNAVVGSAVKMLRRLIGEDIDLAWMPGTQVWPVHIDPSQVDQILANLCVNSRDAIGGVGEITIETENINLDAVFCDDHVHFLPGQYAVLAVSDNGHGIAPEALDKIFDPFFTTKGLGKGTGLGLATVYGIVKQNKGFIDVCSDPGKGTTIKIYLPRQTGQAVMVHGDRSPDIPPGCGETILIVEDDGAILKLGQRMLQSLGYTVLSAATPREADRLAAKHAGGINLLITDVVMPEMNGRQLSEHLNHLCPNLKTLFMSGYTADAIAHRGVMEEGLCFINKPFSKKDLAVKVRQVLDNANGN